MVRLKSYKEIVEMSQAKKGDWKKGQYWFLNMTSEFVTNMNSEFISNIFIPKLNNKYEFRKFKDEEKFILGYWDIEEFNSKEGIEEKNIFVAIFVIDLKLTKIKNYNNVVNVDGVAVDIAKKLNGKDISLIIYKYLVNEMKYTILYNKV